MATILPMYMLTLLKMPTEMRNRSLKCLGMEDPMDFNNHSNRSMKDDGCALKVFAYFDIQVYVKNHATLANW